MLQGGPLRAIVPWRVANVLWNVRIDVSVNKKILVNKIKTKEDITYFPSSSTSAGAVPALRASSSSLAFFHSSLDCFFVSVASVLRIISETAFDGAFMASRDAGEKRKQMAENTLQKMDTNKLAAVVDAAHHCPLCLYL